MNNIINIFYAPDNNHAKLAFISMLSILKNTENKIQFNILHSDLSKKNIEMFQELNKYKNCTIVFEEINKDEFENFSIPSWVTIQAWYRIKIPKLKNNIDKALYLDCDTLITQDIAQLFNIDISNYALAGIKDVINSDKNSKKLNCKDDNYINSGVLLINCKKWREENIFEKIKNYVLCKSIDCDQDAINKALDGNKLLLSQKYNYMEVWWQNNRNDYKNQEKTEYKKAQKNPFVIHFTGIKPNNLKCKNSYKYLWWEYAKNSIIYQELLEEYQKNSDKYYDKISYYFNTQPFKSFWLIARKILKLTKTYKA